MRAIEKNGAELINFFLNTNAFETFHIMFFIFVDICQLNSIQMLKMPIFDLTDQFGSKHSNHIFFSFVHQESSNNQTPTVIAIFYLIMCAQHTAYALDKIHWIQCSHCYTSTAIQCNRISNDNFSMKCG